MQPYSQRNAQLVTALILVVALFLAAGNGLASSPDSSQELSNDELVSQGMRYNAEGDYDAARDVWKRLAKLDPEHPAANVYATETLYWRMVHEEDSSRFDALILRECEEAIRKARAWVDVRPLDALGHFYLGQALMQEGRLHGVNGRVLKAGRLGERARRLLERSLELDPDLIDAKFPLGLYYYYASLVPDLFRWLSFLWFIPTGDADTGIAFMEEVAQTGDLYRVTATFYLADIRSEHPDRLDREWADAAYRSMHERYPNNAIIHLQLLQMFEAHKEYEALILEARRLESHPGQGREQRGPATMARVWRARGELMLNHVDDAWQTLAVFGADGPENPDWGSRWVKVTRAQILDIRGERSAALDFYRQVLSLKLDPIFSRAMSIAEEGVERPFAFDR